MNMSAQTLCRFRADPHGLRTESAWTPHSLHGFRADSVYSVRIRAESTGECKVLEGLFNLLIQRFQ